MTGEDFFSHLTWPEVVVKCTQCHVAGGASGQTRLVLKAPSEPGAVMQNFAIFGTAAGNLVQQGDSLLLLKPSAQVTHGGGQVIKPDSMEYGVLKHMLALYRTPISCDGTTPPPPVSVPPPRAIAEGTVLMDPVQTLRKATLQLAGRLPTVTETATVMQGGLDALDGVLLPMMHEPLFYGRIRQMFNDIFLTDANIPLTLDMQKEALDYSDYSPPCGYNDYNCYDSSDGKLISKAAAREPVEFVVHALREERPITEIITAQYRLLNRDSARMYNVDAGLSADALADPDIYEEFQLPKTHSIDVMDSEYAGLLTTESFLYRYPATATNRSRKRARYFYLFFQNFDILKTAPRIDLTQVDFSQKPWLHNSQCTGCHNTIDPVASDFMNWSECYGATSVHYYSPASKNCSGQRWWSTSEMLQAGFNGQGYAQSDYSAPLVRLVQDAIAVNNGHSPFADAMVHHVYKGLVGQEPLSAPQDMTAPDYASLQTAYQSQSSTLGDLATLLINNNWDLRALIVATIKTPYYRMIDADKPGRVELTEIGGVLIPPETLHDKIAATVGYHWSDNTPDAWGFDGLQRFMLLQQDKFRIFYGGIDSSNVINRQTLPSGLTAAISERMALEMACRYVGIDFNKMKESRLLFPLVDVTQTPTGDPQADADIVSNITYLHDRLLGETLAADDPELMATYQLLNDAYTGLQGQPAALPDTCKANHNLDERVDVPGGITTDPSYMIRSWQAVIAYMLMDYKFLFQ
jgi:hypothetical protein